MTLPFPNSPVKSENIATSISRIEQNLEYLDGQVSLSSLKYVQSSFNMTTLLDGANTLNVTGAGFTPTACIIFASEATGDSQSWGFADAAGEGSTRRDYAGAIAASTTQCGYLQQSATNVVTIALDSFTADGADFTLTKTNSPTSAAFIIILFIK